MSHENKRRLIDNNNNTNNEQLKTSERSKDLKKNRTLEIKKYFPSYSSGYF